MENLASLQMESVSLREQKVFEGKAFPLVLRPLEGAEGIVVPAWIQKAKLSIERLLFHHGAILFRDFPVNTPEDFDLFVKSFGYNAMPYIGGAAPRKVVVGNVFTSNEAPPESVIPFHHEMAQVPSYPLVLFFYCDVAPSEGGQTPIVLSNAVYEQMKASARGFVDKLEQEGVVYTRVLPNGDDPTSAIGRGWQSTYDTDNPEVAQQRAKAQGSTVEWLPNGCMMTTTAIPAIKEDPRTGKMTWFNSIQAAYHGWRDSRNVAEKSVRFGNGDSMNEGIMDKLRDVLNENAVDFVWQKGDVLMIDNRQALHGRRSFKPPRRILAALTN